MSSFLRRWRGAPAEPERDREISAPDVGAEIGDDVDTTSPLAERLARMQWPTPPDEVKERCLREILERVSADAGSPSDTDEDRSGRTTRRAAG